MTNIKAYAAMEAGGELQPYDYEPGELAHNYVEIAVSACGVCHSDLSMINNDWRSSKYPLIAGHEAVGTVTQIGKTVKNLKVGQVVGVGWNSESCLHCSPCLSGSHQRCTAGVTTIRGHGGFADRIRVQDIWAVPLPDGMDSRSAGPLFCGGITVFAPMIDFDLKPTDRIGIIGGSYGGYMVCAALAFRPDAFDVGVDIFGVTNWHRTVKNIPPWWEAQRKALEKELGDFDDEEYFKSISPLFHASNMKKPLMVLQGANDPRVLQVESDEMVEAVRANGVSVEYLVFPDEGHGFRKKENQLNGYKGILDFCDKYLKDAE